jgi:hypothetical protein
MRVKIFDVTGPAQKTFRAECDLAECFPDDPDAVAAAREELQHCAQAWFGGGAAPITILERVS